MADEVRYTARGPGFSLLLTADGAAVRTADRLARMRVRGARPDAVIEPVRELPGKVNYFLGRDHWRTNIPTFSRVRYRGIYEGIDLVFYVHERELEYDFVVKPGATPDRIELEFRDAGVHVDSQGNLIAGPLRWRKPVAYQEVDGRRREVAARFTVDGERVGFATGAYDPRLPLVIDPVLDYSQFIGGTGADRITRVKVDSAGNAYLLGSTFIRDIGGSGPSTFDIGDIFIAKLSATGGLAWVNYFGGAGIDDPRDLALDASGGITIAGSSDSPNLPIVGGLQAAHTPGTRNAFVARFDPAGTRLMFSTYLGGPQMVTGLAVGDDGAIYLTGSLTPSGSVTLPLVNAMRSTPAGMDAFVMKLSPSADRLLYSTYLGGGGTDHALAIAVDAQNAIYITGDTDSPDFATDRIQGRGGATDCFVSKINSAGDALLYSVRLGGFDVDSCVALALDSAGRATVTGRTQSPDFPTRYAAATARGGHDDSFVARLNVYGIDLEYSTYLGGRGSHNSVALALDPAGNAYVTGNTYGGLPLVNPLQAIKPGGSNLLMRTSDSGSTWTSAAAFAGTGLISVAVDPTNPALLFAGAGDCYSYRSLNAGVTWEGRISGLCLSFSVLPSGTVIGASTSGVVRSLDHGATWTLRDTRARGSNLTIGTGAIFLPYSHSIYKSTDEGASWTQINVGRFVYSVAAHPTSPTILYAAAEDLLRSEDGGATWTPVSVPWTGGATAVRFVPSDSGLLYVVVDGQLWRLRISGSGLSDMSAPLPAAITALAVDASTPGVVFAGTAGRGVFRSADYGTTWTAVSNGIADAAVETLVIDPSNPARLYAGLRLQPDAFVVKIGPAGGPFLWSTYLGGSGYEEASAIAAQADGAVYVGGAVDIYTDIPSSDFPYTTERPARPLGNWAYTSDAFVAKISPATPGCSPQLKRRSTAVPHPGGATYVNVVAPTGCAWTLATPPWISVAGSPSGTGLATVQLSVAQNGGMARSGAITVSQSGSSVSVSQEGAVLPLISPANGSQQSATPTMEWGAVAGATKYAVYIAPNSPSAPAAYWETTSLSMPRGPLPTGVSYYWRVVASTPGGYVYSAWWQFTVATPSSAITLLSPADGATGVSLRPTLAWSPVAGVSIYDGHIGKTSPPPPSGQNIGQGTYTFASDLEPDTVYYWRVVARNNEAQPSPIWSFRTLSRPLGPVAPSSGSGWTQMFTADFKITDKSYTDVYFLMNAAQVTASACFVRYSVTDRQFQLRNDADTGWVTQPQAGSTLLRNSRCALDVQNSSASVTGTLVRLQLSLWFETAFNGTKNVYLMGHSPQGDEAWQQTSTWIVPYPSPQVGPVTPASGGGRAVQLTADYLHPSGTGSITGAFLLINSTLNPERACMVYYDSVENRFYLSTDDARSWIPAPDGSAVENSQCELQGTPRSVMRIVNTLRIGVGLRFKSSFAGSKGVHLLARTATGDVGWNKVGSWFVEAGADASAGPLTPDNGTATSQTFKAAFSHPQGPSAFTSAFLSINWSLSPQRGCVVYYQPDSYATGRFALLDDTGSQWLYAASGGLVENSQCALNTALSSGSILLSELQLTISLAFKPGFAGAKEIYLMGRTASGDVGWTRAGTWTVPGATPSVGPFTPSEGVGSTQIFSASYRNPAGTASFVGAFALINTDLVAAGSCAVYYEPAQARFYLLDDAGLNWATGGPSGGGILQNSQCSLDLAHTSASAYGTQLTLQLALSFKPGFAGAKRVYMLGRTYSADTGWQHVGAWNVPAGTAAVGPVTPAAGVGSSQVFTAPFQYPGGGAAFTGAFFLMNSDLVAAQSCTAYYDPRAGRFYLLNDAGADWGTGGVAGAGLLQNSQCALDLSKTSASVSGNTLTWNLGVVFKPAFAGSKRIYLLGRTSAGDVGWQQSGTWTIP